MKKLYLLCLLILITLIGGWFWFNRQFTVTKSLFAMGTVIEITVHGSKQDQAIENAFREIKRIEALTSNTESSDLVKVNRAAGIKPVKVSSELIAIINKVASFYPELSGSFDPTVGPLIDLWGFNPQGEPHLPAPDQIRRTLPLIGFNRVIINRKAQTVFLPVKGMKLDLGGIAKGYAVDRAYSVLKKSGIKSALINGGGSSIRVIGKKTGRTDWRLGIGHPRRNGELLGVLSLPHDRALGTSADTQNFFIYNGIRYSHLINPQTGYPAREKILVTATAPTAIDADLLSTAFFILPVSKIKDFIAAHREFGVIIDDASGKLTNVNESTFRAE